MPSVIRGTDAFDSSGPFGLNIYTSPAFSYPTSTTSWNHGLSTTPVIFGAYFLCTQALGTFSVGDRISIHGTGDDDSSGSVVWADSTKVGVGFNSSYFLAYPDGGGRVNLSSYRSHFNIYFWALA